MCHLCCGVGRCVVHAMAAAGACVALRAALRALCGGLGDRLVGEGGARGVAGAKVRCVGAFEGNGS